MILLTLEFFQLFLVLKILHLLIKSCFGICLVRKGGDAVYNYHHIWRIYCPCRQIFRDFSYLPFRLNEFNSQKCSVTLEILAKYRRTKKAW